MNPREELFVRSFIMPAKRERYISFLSNDKRRTKFINSLDHLRDLDETKTRAIPSNEQSAADICRILQEKGARANCYVVSTDSALDGKELALRETLEEIVGGGFGTYVSCIPGKLGYYEGEDARERFILEA